MGDVDDNYFQISILLKCLLLSVSVVLINFWDPTIKMKVIYIINILYVIRNLFNYSTVLRHLYYRYAVENTLYGTMFRTNVLVTSKPTISPRYSSPFTSTASPTTTRKFLSAFCFST